VDNDIEYRKGNSSSFSWLFSAPSDEFYERLLRILSTYSKLWLNVFITDPEGV
jgi:hypothetical protein